MPPPINPTVTLEMSLETFNQMQRQLARGPYGKTADIIMNFRQQVQTQLERIQAQSASPPTRLRAVPDAETGEEVAD